MLVHWVPSWDCYHFKHLHAQATYNDNDGITFPRYQLPSAPESDVRWWDRNTWRATQVSCAWPILILQLAMIQPVCPYVQGSLMIHALIAFEIQSLRVVVLILFCHSCNSLQGTISPVGSDLETPFKPAPFNIPDENNSMLQIGISEYFLQSASLVYYAAGAFDVSIAKEVRASCRNWYCKGTNCCLLKDCLYSLWLTRSNYGDENLYPDKVKR